MMSRILSNKGLLQWKRPSFAGRGPNYYFKKFPQSREIIKITEPSANTTPNILKIYKKSRTVKNNCHKSLLKGR